MLLFVQVDEYLLPKEAALQLAGYHAQAQHNNYDEGKLYRYFCVSEIVSSIGADVG